MIENILDTLKSYIVSNLNTQIVTSFALSPIIDDLIEITDEDVVVGDMDYDKYTGKCKIFLLLDNEVYEEETIAYDYATSQIQVYLIVRKASSEVLYRQALRCAAALKKILRDCTDFIKLQVNDLEFYEGIEGSKDAKGFRLGVSILMEETV